MIGLLFARERSMCSVAKQTLQADVLYPLALLSALPLARIDARVSRAGLKHLHYEPTRPKTIETC
jgi:hypothetical protein